MSATRKDFITLGFNFSKEQLLELTSQLDELKELTKEEQHGEDGGYAITYKIKNKEVFFAMIHSNKKSYLVRANKNLFTVNR